jgi:tetratricopeptide (TPR) repeat protein
MIQTIRTHLTLLVFALLIAACKQEKPVQLTAATSYTKADSSAFAAAQELAKDSSETNFIWYGRRLGYINQMDSAIGIFSKGIHKFPNSWKLYRFRGHRYISTRRFQEAIEDLQRAALLMKDSQPELEPDGIPNKINTPLSTYQYNVWYHLGLAHYLLNDLKQAEVAFKNCLALSDNDDLLVASSDWLYMIYRQSNQTAKAREILKAIHNNMTIVENDSYWLRLRMYQGNLKPESLLSLDTVASDYDLNIATQGYGVGNWYLCNGDTAKAKEIFNKVLAGKSTFAFGYISAEARLANIKGN